MGRSMKKQSGKGPELAQAGLKLSLRPRHRSSGVESTGPGSPPSPPMSKAFPALL